MSLHPVSTPDVFAATQPVGARVFIDPYYSDSANTNWTRSNLFAIGTLAGQLFVTRESSGAQNAEITFKVGLAAGTWTITWMSYKLANSGIYTISIDSVSQGTVDGYNASTQVNQLLSLSGISVTNPGLHDLNFKMATKNASSSSYFGDLQEQIVLERTA